MLIDYIRWYFYVLVNWRILYLSNAVHEAAIKMFCSLEIKIQATTPVISLVSLIAKGVKEEKKAGVLNFDRGSASRIASPRWTACLYAAALKIHSPILLSSLFTIPTFTFVQHVEPIWSRHHAPNMRGVAKQKDRKRKRERERKSEREGQQIGAHTEFAPCH